MEGPAGPCWCPDMRQRTIMIGLYSMLFCCAGCIGVGFRITELAEEHGEFVRENDYNGCSGLFSTVPPGSNITSGAGGGDSKKHDDDNEPKHTCADLARLLSQEKPERYLYYAFLGILVFHFLTSSILMRSAVQRHRTCLLPWVFSVVVVSLVGSVAVIWDVILYGFETENGVQLCLWFLFAIINLHCLYSAVVFFRELHTPPGSKNTGKPIKRASRSSYVLKKTAGENGDAENPAFTHM